MTSIIAMTALSLSACSPTGTPAQKMAAWSKATGARNTLGQLARDIASAVARVPTGDPTTVHTLCAIVSTDAQSANDDLPTPDRGLTTELAADYGHIYDAAQNCYHAAGRPDALSRAVAELQSAAGRLAVAQTSMARLGG
jgi:hypothetical protein